MVPLQNDFLTQFTKVTVITEVMCIHSVWTVYRTQWKSAVTDGLRWKPNSHCVIPQCIQHQIEKNDCVYHDARRLENCWNEKDKIQGERDSCRREKVGRSYGVEQPESQHPQHQPCDINIQITINNKQTRREANSHLMMPSSINMNETRYVKRPFSFISLYLLNPSQ